MSEKRFVIDEEGISDNKTDNWYCWKEEVVDLLNKQQSKIQLLEKVNEDLREVNKENQLLHEENVKQCERWKNLYELKDAEVTARVDALNRVCEYYTSEVLFKSDVDPNKAVKEVINRILNTEVEMMSDCDNCICLDQDTNGEYCHKGHTGHKTLIHDCCDFEHWNTLTDEEKKQCND